MRLPQKGSRSEMILAHLHHAPATVWQGIERHGHFNISITEIRGLYDSMVNTGCATVMDLVYTISVQARNYLDGALSQPAPARPAVGPAYHPPARPLRTALLRQVEGRAGAYDYRNVPSLMGSSRVPYVSSLTIAGTDNA